MNLHIKANVISIHHKMEVLDDADQPVYRASSKAITLHDRTYLEDAAGNEVAYIHAKAVSLHHVYYVEMAGGQSFELSEQLFHMKDIIDVPDLGWQIRGNVLAFDFEVVDADERVLALAHRKLVSVHGVYDLEIADEGHADELVALFIVVNHIVQSRSDAMMMSSTGGSGQS
ncbi:LURP-one-related/scramblase family protein [Arabiibacter massiliensis]|uniref:LURP-one-related/scramblase family protein n=1 Tax=Arabiibacter massiliensis TaxID=1870985 RepID=UPI0009BB6FF3|nr:LURP-one-related family protein [Arabiibacter massiliensis]